MTVLYLAEYNTKCCAVIFQNIQCVKAQKLKDISNHENIILYLKPLKPFLGKIKICDVTLRSGAFEREIYDGITRLLKIGEEKGRLCMYILLVIWYVLFQLMMFFVNI